MPFPCKEPATAPVPGIDAIRVAPARDAIDQAAVLRLRFEGYKGFFADVEETADELDAAPGTTLFLARCGREGTPLGTLRVAAPPAEPELARLLDLESLLEESARPVAEASRFVVKPGPRSTAVKLLLQKAFYRVSLDSGARTMLIWARPGGCRLYSRLLFRDLGDRGEFAHPRLGGRRHRTLALPVHEAAARNAAAGHGLHSFFVEQAHPNLET